MKDRKLFNNYMTMLGEVFDKEFTKALVEAYWLLFKDVADDKMEFAFKKALKCCRFFPRPAELFSFAGETEEINQTLIVDRAHKQAELVLSFIRSPRHKINYDPITQQLIRGRFNISRLVNEMTEKDEKWFVRDFVQAYVEYETVEAVGLLQHITGPVKQLTLKIGQIEERRDNES